MARPSKYNEKIVDDICGLLAEGNSLVSICERSEMPGYSTVMVWVNKYPEFREKYARAREVQSDYMADSVVVIADKSTPDTVQVDRLRIDSRKWYASKLNPKKYGDKQQLDVDMSGNQRLDVSGLDPQAALEAYQQMVSGKRGV